MHIHQAAIGILETGKIPIADSPGDAVELHRQLVRAAEELLDAIARIGQATALFDLVPKFASQGASCQRKFQKETSRFENPLRLPLNLR